MIGIYCIINKINNSGKNNPRAKYTIWDINCVKYEKSKMFKNDRTPNPCNCFSLRYKGKRIPMGVFLDFTSVELINDLIDKFIKEDD